MAREAFWTPGVVELDEADLTPAEQALVAAAQNDALRAGTGQVLTGQDAVLGTEDLALLVVGSPDLERTPGGRPTLDPDGGPSTARQFRLPRSSSDRLDQVAAAQGRTPSALIREAVERYLQVCRPAPDTSGGTREEPCTPSPT